jgi:hypothetical protein
MSTVLSIMENLEQSQSKLELWRRILLKALLYFLTDLEE